MKSHGRNVRSLNLHESAYVYVLVAQFIVYQSKCCSFQASCNHFCENLVISFPNNLLSHAQLGEVIPQTQKRFNFLMFQFHAKYSLQGKKLTHFLPLISFSTSRKHQKISGFLRFLGSIEKKPVARNEFLVMLLSRKIFQQCFKIRPFMKEQTINLLFLKFQPFFRGVFITQSNI